MDHDMDINRMVIRCLETFQAGYGTNKKLVEINWIPWNEKRTPEIRCVFNVISPGSVCCIVYSAVSWTHGTDFNTGRAWVLSDKVLLREKNDEEAWPGEKRLDPGAHFGKMV